MHQGQETLTYKKDKRPNHGPKLFTLEWYLSLLKICMGSMIIAFGFTAFFIPHNIIPGGLFGFSTVLGHITGYPIGAISFLINVPILMWGFKYMGKGFGIRTIIAMTIASFSVDFFIYLLDGFVITPDILVSTIFGGVLIGTGVSLTLREEATTGGTDTLAKIFSQKTNIPVHRWVMIIDGLIVVSGLITFRDLNLAPYAVIAVFTISKTIDTILSGFDNKKVLFVISEKHAFIREVILKDLDRGGTYIDGKGLFFNEDDRKIIMTAVSRKESVILENHVKEIDPHAFIVSVNAHEVKGTGFRALNT